MEMVKKTLGSVATYINGRAFKPSEWKPQGLPIIRIQNLNSTREKFNYSDEQHEDRYLIKNGDLLFAWSASLGAHIWKGSDAWLNQHIFKVIPHDDINKMYLYYFLLNVVADLYAKTHGSGMVHITKGPFLNTAIPVPPLVEQERIVEKIEELFSQLDDAVAEINKVKEKLVIYRQVILKEMFDELQSRDPARLEQIVDKIAIGPFGTLLHKRDYVSGGIPLINPQHIKRNVIVEDTSVSVTEEKAIELSNYKLCTNDIIMGRRGEMGRVAPVTERENGWICGTGSIIIRLKEEYDANLYALFLRCPQVVGFLEKAANGTTMNNLNESIVAKIPIPQVSRENGYAVLSTIARKISSCNKIENQLSMSCNKADYVRKSILKLAFEGKL